MNDDLEPVESLRELMGRFRMNRDLSLAKQYAHIKRFFECYWGDPEFRDALKEQPEVGVDLARSRGIDLDPADLEPLWKNGCVQAEADVRDFSPLTKIWFDCKERRGQMLTLGHKCIHNSITQPRYKAWHARQIARGDWEMGPYNRGIGHAIIAFELSKGCSVGCWFCGVGSERLQSVFERTPENKALWRDILEVCKEEFGPAAEAGFCYWATEPADNPHYLDFLEDYHEIIGVAPATTTAVPLRDLDWTRKLMDACKKDDSLGSRFSITSLQNLRRVHEIFSAEELASTELVLQNRESLCRFNSSGRARNRQDSECDDQSQETLGYDSGTISCVTGFHVNMVTRAIKLMSPCFASDRWPLGYREFWESSFTSAEGFRAALREAINDHMPTHLSGNQILKFNESLNYEKRDDGFVLQSRFRSYSVEGNPVVAAIGELVSAGNHTTSEAMKLVARQGADIFTVSGHLQHLYEKGLIDDPHVERSN